mmetsp:Transcript_7397/g.10782  ORF Transcript_7397/g.10782 Transcript_7397/m.10782 type:complete len:138 (-) Transcript_7397:1421-1834(-)
MIETNNQTAEMTIVPAVDSRLLRFPGQFLHAVPRPVGTWIHRKEEVEGNVLDASHRRSVVLFNLWPITHKLPQQRTNATRPPETEQKYQKQHTCHQNGNLETVSVEKLRFEAKISDFEIPLMGDEIRRGTPKRSAIV